MQRVILFLYFFMFFKKILSIDIEVFTKFQHTKFQHTKFKHTKFKRTILKKLFKRKTLFFKKKHDKKVLISKRVVSFLKTNQNKFRFQSKRKKKIQSNFFVKKFFLKSLYKSRNLFRTSFLLNKKTRQKRITKLIFRKSKKFYKNNTYEYSLLNILLRSHFFYFIGDAFIFLNHSLVYLNGTVCNNYDSFLGIGDKVQLEINPPFYNYLKKCRNFFKKKLALIKYNSWMFYRKKHYQNRKYFRLKKRKSPNYYLHFFLFKLDIPKFLEVDFLILTSIILKKIDISLQTTYFFKKLFSYKLFSLYNFKKIN